MRLNQVCMTIGALLFAGSVMRAQTATGSIRGSVQDPNEAVVVAARLTLTNISTNESRTAVTNDAGLYSFNVLPPATYRLEAEAAGFKRFVRDSIKLDVGLTATIPIQLELGQTTDTVTVSGEAPLLEEGNASLGHMVSNATILNLPTNGRNSYGFASLVPGVRAPRGFTQVSVGMYNEQFVSINGARAYQSNFQMDGGSNSNPAFNGPTLFPSVDMVQEYRVQTNNFSAEFTNSAGGVVNLVTKSGTNQWHGSLFEFLRNDKLVGNNFFNNMAGLPRGVFRFNQFGATFGGPVLLPRLYNGKDRTFFFFTYEGLRWIQSVTTNGSVPTLPQRNGDFSQTRNAAGQLIAIYDPFSAPANPNQPGRVLRMPFPGNMIPASRMDMVARNLIPYLPLPTSAGDPGTGVNNYINSSSAPIRKNLFSGRVDHSITNNQKIFGRFSHNDTFFGRPYVFSKGYTPASITRGNELDPAEQGVINYTNIVTPTLVLEVSSSYVEYQLHRHGASLDFTPCHLASIRSCARSRSGRVFRRSPSADLGTPRRSTRSMRRAPC